ncbi:uncharacterized protein LOC108664518 [Hyalella azteca]|uniref:Uncharacterized protein LOC108664518 n=1 Tax=Hyalella azteca TaxID=294128 RepID=A0A8B7MZA9_HYAAZ|nr:uncharacterized protein LOC108664518 [Hyalella azteca]
MSGVKTLLKRVFSLGSKHEMARPEIHGLVVAVNAEQKPTLHSILSIPSTMTSTSRGGDYYSIVMVDVSGSMSNVWPEVKENWNRILAPCLNGTTDIFTFGTEVRFRRSQPTLENSDFDCSATNLTDALKMINLKIHQSKEANCRVFLITDGAHNCEGSPASEIDNLRVPPGKTVEVYLLGVGYSFPVQYSVDIRSKLHNGSASCPTLFWSRENLEMAKKMTEISQEVTKGSLKFKVSIPGKIIPLIEETKGDVRCGEFLYYEMEPEQLKSSLIITELESKIPIEDVVNLADAKFLVSKLFKQWNAVILQRHRNKLGVPNGFFEMMQSIFDLQIREIDPPANSQLKDRLGRKNIKQIQLDFSTLMNQSRSIISVESKYKNELELAEAILKSTVQSRYDDRLLKIKGHGDSEWESDTLEMKKVYESLRKEIEALPQPEPDDCCRVLMNSFIGDLKDPNFFDVLKENKMEFLTTMTFTGIPILAPVKDSAQINPWTMYIKNICVSPFEILSQRVIESALAVEAASSSDKEIRLQKDNPNSVCNAIVPIIPKEHCKTLERLVRTNVFSIGATFCILKNALIVDHSCHLAALGCVWLKTIQDYPAENRPEFIKKRLCDVEETSKIYLSRNTIVNYVSALQKQPALALMTESEAYQGSVLRCESIVKPAFLTGLVKDQLRASENTSLLLKLILVEFLGRCLTSYSSKCPYMDLTTSLTDETRETKVDEISTILLEKVQLSGAELLAKCYARQDVEKFAQEKLANALKDAIENNSLLPQDLELNMNKIERLRHSGSAGHVGWQGLVAWANELAYDHSPVPHGPPPHGPSPLFSRAQVDEAFSAPMVCSYVHHALEYRQSRERMKKELLGPAEARDAIFTKLANEQDYYLKNVLLPKLLKSTVQRWEAEYDEVHKAVAVPLSRLEIIQRAVALGVNVNEQNFDQIYKYRENVRMCRNCCHVEKCPHFLKPNARFNCHIETERKQADYPHTLHLLVSSDSAGNQDQLVEKIANRSAAGTRARKKPPPIPSDDLSLLKLQVEHLAQAYIRSAVVV